ncbi:ABC transporter substrate-binding protein [Vibrio nigripulchritudo]|uniref:ABC transporter substrate-binding protein n=1 Tax=Vibrio nigripulchritudo TaxID=28173 RepID=UPI00190C5178|nr:ABC transporter substrate-binding protein [Vibrio nigripulchritudo]
MKRYLFMLLLVIPALMLVLVWGNLEEGIRIDSAPTIKIAVSQTPLSAPLFVAQYNQFFSKHHLDVELVPCQGGVQCAAMLLSRQVDYATVSETVALLSYRQDKRLSLIASFVKSNNDLKLLTLKSSGIESFEQMEHKRIGIVKSSASEFYFDLLMISHGMQGMNVERVYMSPESQVTALLNRKVDAVSVWEPNGFHLQQSSEEPVCDLSIAGIYQLSFNLVKIRSREDNVDLDMALINSVMDAVKWIEEHVDESSRLIAQYLVLESGQTNRNWEDYIFHVSLDNSLLSNMQLQARWASERGIIQGPPVDVRTLINKQALERVNKTRSDIW